MRCGNLLSKVGTTFVVLGEANQSGKALDEGTIICLENRSVVGAIEEVRQSPIFDPKRCILQVLVVFCVSCISGAQLCPPIDEDDVLLAHLPWDRSLDRLSTRTTLCDSDASWMMIATMA